MTNTAIILVPPIVAFFFLTLAVILRGKKTSKLMLPWIFFCIMFAMLAMLELPVAVRTAACYNTFNMTLTYGPGSDALVAGTNRTEIYYHTEICDEGMIRFVDHITKMTHRPFKIFLYLGAIYLVVLAYLSRNDLEAIFN